MQKTVYAIIILFLCGCGIFSPSKRLERIYRNNPELVRNDTTIFYDTIIEPGKTIYNRIPYKIWDTTIIYNNHYATEIIQTPRGLDVTTQTPNDTTINKSTTVKTRYPVVKRVVPVWYHLFVFVIFITLLVVLFKHR